MRTVTLVEFRKNAEGVLRRIRQGESVLLTRRGRPAARLEPVGASSVELDDPIYHLGTLAAARGKSLTNEEIDRVIYGA